MSKYLLLALTLFSASAMAQITDRELPAEWENLVKGARHMDRFLPMEGSVMSADVWGCKDVKPRLVDNGIELPGVSFWGGNIIKGEDGLYHLFVCGWPENSPRGHMFWSKSTVFHATSENSYGPFKVVSSIGKGHNPEAYRLADGRWLVYTIDGYYHATDPNGIWWFSKFNFDNRDRKIIEGLSNLTFARRQDGSMLMVCRGGGVWISRDGVSDDWHQISDGRVYPAVKGEFEDPVVWRDSVQYHLIVNDWLGRIAWYERSKDGLNWIVEPGEAYTINFTTHKDGSAEKWFKYERPKVLQDEYGRVEQMNFAVIDTIKWEDLPNDHHSSKNVCIPMNKGLLISVLNTTEVTTKTKAIEVLVRSEEGFDAQNDLDIESLRFGSYKEVNFGRGAKVTKTRKQGKDLVLIFKGKDTGIDSEEFAPKLLGKKKDGHMVFGYSKLPCVDYTPALVSTRRPKLADDGKSVSVIVENYGLSESQPVRIKIMSNGVLVGEGEAPALKPYDAHELVIKTEAKLEKKEDIPFDVTISSDNKTTHF